MRSDREETISARVMSEAEVEPGDGGGMICETALASSGGLAYVRVLMNAGGATRIELWLGVGAAALLGLGCFLILLPFLPATLWAAILCFATWPLFIRLKSMLNDRGTLAATLATLLLSAIIIVPAAYLVSKLSANIDEIIAATQKLIHEGPPAAPAWVASLPFIGSRLNAYWTLMRENSSARLAEIAKWLPTLRQLLLGGGRALGEGVFQIVLSLLMILLMYRDGEAAANRLRTTIGLIGGARGRHLLEVAGITMRAVVYGVLGTALFQGVLAAIGYAIARVPGAALLGFITFVLAVIPGGPALIAVPAVFWLYNRGSIPWAIFVVVWIFIVGNLDNILRPFLISRGGSTTPLILIVLGILGGVMTFGLIGLFLGPTILAVGYRMFDEWSSSSEDSLLPPNKELD
jgi:predicted PurR-regulated permease PerM